MTRLFLVFAFLGAFAADIQAQSLREAVSLMLAREQELAVGSPKTAREAAGFVAGAPGDAVNQQLRLSLRQFLSEGESGALAEQTEEHRMSIQGYLENAAVEDRVVALAEVYLALHKTDRRIREAEENVRWHQAVRDKAGEQIADTGGVDGFLKEQAKALEVLREARRAALSRFERMVGQAPESLCPPSMPSLPADRQAVDLARNWNYVAAAESVAAVEALDWGRDRNRMPGIFLVANQAAGTGAASMIQGQGVAEPSADRSATERHEAWQKVKALELRSAADVQRQYSLSVLWRERQADLLAVNSLRIQTGLLASVASSYEKEFLSGARSLGEVLGLRDRLYGSRVRLIEAEASLLVGAYRILGVQGRCVDYVMGQGYLDRQLLGERERPGAPPETGFEKGTTLAAAGSGSGRENDFGPDSAE